MPSLGEAPSGGARAFCLLLRFKVSRRKGGTHIRQTRSNGYVHPKNSVPRFWGRCALERQPGPAGASSLATGTVFVQGGLLLPQQQRLNRLPQLIQRHPPPYATAP